MFLDKSQEAGAERQELGIPDRNVQLSIMVLVGFYFILLFIGWAGLSPPWSVP